MEQANISCHDCGKPVSMETAYSYQFNEKPYAKCPECYQKDSVLRNVQPTEVYSRVVGYIRPVKQWNKGKQAEFSDRKEYVVNA